MAVLSLLVTHIPDHRSPDAIRSQSIRYILSRLDLVGFVFFAGFALMVELAIEWGGSEYPWSSSVVIGLFVGGFVSLIVFVAWEYRSGDVAMLPVAVVCKREVWSSSLYLGFLASAMMVCSFYLPIYFQAVKGVTALLSGVYMLPGIASQILMAITSGALSRSLHSPRCTCCHEHWKSHRLTLTTSWENGVLSALGIGQRCHCRFRRRCNDHFDGRFVGCPVGHVPIHCWIRPRLWWTNSELLPLFPRCAVQ